VWLKLIAGIHCTIVVAVGTGTIINYLARQAQELHTVAVVLSSRFDDEQVRTRLNVLEGKFKAAQTQVKPPQGSTGGSQV
jgi:hypothetical protein